MHIRHHFELRRIDPPIMPRGPPPGFYLISVIVLFFWFIYATRNLRHEPRAISLQDALHGSAPSVEAPHLTPETQYGDAIAPRLGNETLKAELGRAAWKLFHTTMARFPDKPSQDESDALKSYIYLFARLYPCGECATHFQQIIKKYPPQTSSRSTAAAWACHVHNEVNKSKGKELFDCSNIGDFYDCGCADDEEESADPNKEMSDNKKKKLVEEGRSINKDLFEGVEISREGPINGG